MFGLTLAAQDISFESMVEHQQALNEILLAGADRRHHDVVHRQRLRPGRQHRHLLHLMKPRSQRSESVDEFIARMRGKLFGVPGILAFMQNPPPIQIGGQFTRAPYQLTLQGTDTKEIYRLGAADGRQDAQSAGLSRCQ